MFFINIYSKSPNEVAKKLSNFYPYMFEVDGVSFKCYESFIQCLKFSDPDEQMKVAQMEAKEAKAAGQKQHWQKNGGWLYWQGDAINRYSKQYNQLVERAYDCLCQNPEFSDTLCRSHGILIHTIGIGKIRKKDTVLTSIEFCTILMKKRRKLRKNKKGGHTDEANG